MRIRFSLAILLGLALSAAVYARDPYPAQPSGQSAGGGYGQHGGRGFGGGMGMMGRGVAGTVMAETADHFSIKTFQGDTYTVNFSDSTRIMKMRGGRMDRGMRGNPPEQIKASDIMVGDAIMARGAVDASAKTIGAVAIMKLDPAMAQRMQQMAADYGKTWLMGRVTAIDGTKLTLMSTEDNASHSFVVNENTDFRERRNPVTLADVKVGDLVRVQGALSGDVFAASLVNVMRAPVGGPVGPPR